MSSMFQALNIALWQGNKITIDKDQEKLRVTIEDTVNKVSEVGSFDYIEAVLTSTTYLFQQNQWWGGMKKPNLTETISENYYSILNEQLKRDGSISFLMLNSNRITYRQKKVTDSGKVHFFTKKCRYIEDVLYPLLDKHYIV